MGKKSTTVVNKSKKGKINISFAELPKSEHRDRWGFLDEITNSLANQDCSKFKNNIKNKEIVEPYIFDETINISEIIKISKKNKIPRSQINKVVNDVSKQCFEYLNFSKPINIVVFPTLSSFIKRKLSGVSAYTPTSQHIFYLFVYPNSIQKINENKLKQVVGHEFNHLVFDRYHQQWNGILDNIIAEGLAQNFSFKITGRTEKQAVALTKKESLKQWAKIKKIASSKNLRVFEDLFYNGEQYPLWTGYSVGYWMVKDFLKIHKTMKWNEIMKLSPSIILKKSGWE